jgi:hypothetical protein
VPRSTTGTNPRQGAIALCAALVVFTGAGIAQCCPRCEVGQLARQQVFGPGFMSNLLIAVLPFLFVAIASVWAERIGKPR